MYRCSSLKSVITNPDKSAGSELAVGQSEEKQRIGEVVENAETLKWKARSVNELNRYYQKKYQKEVLEKDHVMGEWLKR
jgi:hypothetical protein